MWAGNLVLLGFGFFFDVTLKFNIDCLKEKITLLKDPGMMLSVLQGIERYFNPLSRRLKKYDS